MPRPVGGEQHRRNIAALRAGGFGLAVALGAVAIWLIVTSTSQKRIEIGVLAGLWGLLLGAYCVFGSRQVYQPIGAGRELDVRSPGQLERRHDAEARQEFRTQLEEMLQREVRASMARELAGLRAEVASLRGELVEKVGGQIRLERIETTRLIGSDLEALQQEVRQLKVRQLAGREGSPDTQLPAGVGATLAADRGTPPVRSATGPIVVEHVERRTAQPDRSAARRPVDTRPVDTRPVDSRPADPRPAQPDAATPEVAVPHLAVPEPVGAAEPPPTPRVAPDPPTAPMTAVPKESAADPFAAMPRIRPFTDFELEPVRPAPDGTVASGTVTNGTPTNGTPTNGAPTNGAAKNGSTSNGSTSNGAAPTDAAASDSTTDAQSGRHATAPQAGRPTGRRHRDESGDNDTLARILARESN